MAKKKDETTVTISVAGQESGTITLDQFEKIPDMIKDKMDGKKFEGLPGKSEEEQAFDKLKEMTRKRQILSLKTDGDTFTVKYRETDRDRVFMFTDRPGRISALVECLQKYKPIIGKLTQEQLDVSPNEVAISYDKYGLSGIAVTCIAACNQGEATLKIKPSFASVFSAPTVEVFEWAEKEIDRIIRNESAIRSEEKLPFTDED